MEKTIIKNPSLNRRYIFILAGMALFLSPFAVIPQLAGEVNMCGAVCPKMFFIIPSAGILEGFRNNIQAEWFGASLVGLILLVTLFMGRIWCSHLCPIGGTTEILGRSIPEKLRINYSFIHAPAFRYAYLFVFIAGAFTGLGSISCKLCNYRVIPFLAGSPFVPGYRTYLISSVGLAGVFIMFLTGFFAKGGRAYCNLLCPVGALDSITNYLGAKLGITRKVSTDTAVCTGCGKCVSSCMVWALELDEDNKIKRDRTSCMSCKECIKVCPQEAIRYGKS